MKPNFRFALVVTLLLAYTTIAASCTQSGSSSSPCGDLNEQLNGTWIRVLGTTNQLPEEFSLNAVGSTGGVYSEPGLGELEYAISDDCTAILLIDGAGELYRTWDVEVSGDSLAVIGPFSRASTYYRQNNCEVAVALLRGGPESINNSSLSRELEFLAAQLERGGAGRICTLLVDSSDDARTQLVTAASWFRVIDISSTRPVQRVLIGHSFGADSVRRVSDNGDLDIMATQLYMIDPIDRELASPDAIGSCHLMQRDVCRPAPPNLVANYLRAPLANSTVMDCAQHQVHCNNPFDLAYLLVHCLFGYEVEPPGNPLNVLLTGTDHGSVVTAATPRIIHDIGALLR